MIFGMLNPEKIWHEHRTDLSTTPELLKKIKVDVLGGHGLVGFTAV